MERQYSVLYIPSDRYEEWKSNQLAGQGDSLASKLSNHVHYPYPREDSVSYIVMAFGSEVMEWRFTSSEFVLVRSVLKESTRS